MVIAAAAVASSGFAPAGVAHAQRGPYLQLGTETSMVVAWRGLPGDAVCYGAAPEALTERASASVDAAGMVARIGGLRAGTRYYYALATGSCPPAAGGDSESYFATAPARGSTVPFRLWVVGDDGTGGSRQAAVQDAMLSHTVGRRPDLFLHMGDMAYDDGTVQQFDDNFVAAHRDVLEHTVCWPTMGNHEGHSSLVSGRDPDAPTTSGPYYDAYVLPRYGEAGGLESGTEAYYAFDYANVHFVVLESHQSSRATGGAMLTWLAADLAATDQAWIVAYWHHPPYTKGSHDSDTESSHVDMRENALPILEAHGVDLVLGGHSHIYERSYLVHGAYDTPTTAAGHIFDTGDGQDDGDGAYNVSGDGALYVVAGHGGASVSRVGDHPLMFFSEVEHGSCLVDVEGGAMTLRNVRYDGVETDHVTLVKGEGLFLRAPIGGERYLLGSTIDILWTSIGATANVRIEYSLDNGTSWTTLEESTENDGNQSWTLPSTPTTGARVRLTDVADPSVSSQSAAFTITASAEQEVISFGGEWEYHDGEDDPGPGWNAMVGGWPTGTGQFGYGDGDEATTLADADPNVPTAYFRRTLAVDQDVTQARLRVLFDDGARVFVNATEVFSLNIEGGHDHGAYATASSEDNQIAEHDIDLSAGNPFVRGDNIIAVMIKQASADSSDLSFDFALTLTLGDASVTDGGVTPGRDGSVTADGGRTPAVTDDGCGCRLARAKADSGPALPTTISGLFLLCVLGLRRRR